MTNITQIKPLEGVKIADFTWVIVGPQTTTILGACGAEVVRVESHKKLCYWRTAGPFKDDVPGENSGGSFAMFNTNKRSVSINLASPKGLDLAKRLVKWADIVIDNYAGGAMSRMGLSYEELIKVNPQIIMLSSCMQGQTGPHASSPGYGTTLSGLSGLCNITGWPDSEPTDIGAYTDFISPHFNVMTIIAALDYRDRTGKGQYIDMSQFENALHFITPQLLDYQTNNRIAGRNGNRCINACPHGAYRCLGDDRWCAIAVITDGEWQSLGKTAGNPQWASDPRFKTLSGRKENEDELEKLLEGWTINHTAEELMIWLQMAGVPGAIVQTARDVLNYDPQLRHRHFFHELEHPVIGKYRTWRPNYLLSKSQLELKRAPLLGEDNDYVFKDILHLSDDEISELVIDGVID